MEQKLRRDRNLGSNLKILREKYDISQEKLCALLQNRGCDIGRSTYAKYENGELNIKISVLIELRKIYNCTYDDFFEETVNLTVYCRKLVCTTLLIRQAKMIF